MTTAKTNDERIGVLLLNLGGPETLDDVQPFLFNLFSDPDIIRLPFRFLQKPLARLISSQRHKKSSGYYAQIGGGSPLRRITGEQAQALEEELRRRGISARTYVAMRYWHPFTEEALAEVKKDAITRLVILPLYPQFSISTTGSSLNRVNEIIKVGGERGDNGLSKIRLSTLCTWQNDSGYIKALARIVKEELAKLPDQDPQHTHILFSAHSVPVSYIREGDPYLTYTQESVRLIMDELGNTSPHSLSFQSKVGPVKWLEPSTDTMIRKLAGDGVSQLLLVPISFVSEHIETLYELDILYRDVAKEVGIAHYGRVPALNCNPDFIAALANLVEQELAPTQSAARGICPIYAVPCHTQPLCTTSTKMSS